MSESPVVHIRKQSLRQARPRGRFSRSARTNYKRLGLKAGASRKAIERAYKLQARRNHPDCGGDPAVMRSITAAYEAICASLPRRGRPRKYSHDHDGFAIVDELNNNEPVLEGFDTRQDAEEALRGLRERLAARAENQTQGDSSDELSVSRDLNGRRARFAVVGTAGAERVRAHRERKKTKAEEQNDPAYWNRVLAEENLSVNRGLYLTDAPAGKGQLITGGWSSQQIETVTAAHDASLGGPDAQTRRSNPQGNGPDQFEAKDATADTADTYLESHLSREDGDIEREIWDNYRHPDIIGSQVDELLGPSVEDRSLPNATSWNKFPTTIDDSEDAEEADIGHLSLWVGSDEFSEFPESGEDEYNPVLDVFEDPEFIPGGSALPPAPKVPVPLAACNEMRRQIDALPAIKLLK